MADKSGTVLNQLFSTGKYPGAAFLFVAIEGMGVLICMIFSRLEAMGRLDG